LHGKCITTNISNGAGESPLGLAALVTALMLQCMPSHGFVEYQIAGVPGAEPGYTWQRFDFERVGKSSIYLVNCSVIMIVIVIHVSNG
jgi:hypothetical protein